ncbi:putative stromal cell-derived factor 2 [Neocallimastix californiae]|uniref:Putative stromal cell-derived factor 2 n=1 Tax=Neocallimastix californiae TaxID=1754190 RepID=A0A1Y2EN37_9FUNG|nr:putative stromal cell-derived factor 2 [Neocallimastix californiae]|eukprot:ORY72968.1 putative stromal cell-derived factor 2 [Neocallimastix californiae]
MNKEFTAVTCSSVVKIAHVSTGYRLHSHGVSYGSGSEQQSVTGYRDADDTNSLWTIHGALNTYCKRGIKCGSTIRLKHLNTGRWLHSHYFRSPLSNQQEVSAFDGSDDSDNWEVQCVDDDEYWIREKPVRFFHKNTKKYLTSSQHFQFRNPIPGQLEVAATERANEQTKWKTLEGIYFSDNTKTN